MKELSFKHCGLLAMSLAALYCLQEASKVSLFVFVLAFALSSFALALGSIANYFAYKCSGRIDYIVLVVQAIGCAGLWFAWQAKPFQIVMN